MVKSKHLASLFPPSFYESQKNRILELRDYLLDSIAGVTKDALRVGPENSEANALGQHIGDAGSDAYDRGFALSILSRGHDSLHEIEAALHRLETGVYGICEISGQTIPRERLEAIPFARYTVQEQGRLEKNAALVGRTPTESVFGLTSGADDGAEEDDNF